MEYTECAAGKGFFRALMASFSLSLIGAVLFCVSKIPWLRKKLPMPGEGPSEAAMHSGSFKIRFWGLPHQPPQDEASGSNGGEPVKVVSMMAVCTSSHIYL